jgi:hypothetical protein
MSTLGRLVARDITIPAGQSRRLVVLLICSSSLFLRG